MTIDNPPTTETIRISADGGIVTLTLDDPSGSANVMNRAYQRSMHEAVAWLQQVNDEVTGVIVTSAKKTFFAGGDLVALQQVTPATAREFFEGVEAMKADLRGLETLGKPVVAVLNGAALGGGLEIALACHHRIAVDNPKARFGTPEVTLGLLPGGGGVTRTVRMLGIADALTEVLGQGQQYPPAQAVEVGIVDEVVSSTDAALEAARTFIAEHPRSQQPWDTPKYKIPGGTPAGGPIQAFLPSLPAVLTQQLKGAPYPAPQAILSAAVEGSQVDFDTASRIESRYLTHLAAGANSTNMIQAFFFDLQAIKKGASRPSDIAPREVHKVGVLGAGMMGAGIAYVMAKAGLQVVLKDVDLAAAERGKGYSKSLLDKAISRGKSTPDKADALLARITPAQDPAALAGCDVVVEAVFEDPALKQHVVAEVMPHLAKDALLCTNTSTLPISSLAEGVERPADFIGLHFFSPVDKMQLVEIICGQQTSQEALARAYDLVLAIGKIPIVVNDSRGFFTSRVIGTFTGEGLAMLAEGVDPISLERAATQAGYPVGTLQITDELNMELMQRIQRQTMAAGGAHHPSYDVVDTMVGLGRPGKKAGKGFFDYTDEGGRGDFWTGLAKLYPVAAQQIPFEDIKDRMLFVEAIEAWKCLDENVVTSTGDANIGSIFGIGYPAWTGGVAQFVLGYPDGGVGGFVRRADELRERYGDRFSVPDSLRERAGAEQVA